MTADGTSLRRARYNSAERVIRVGMWINTALMIMKLAAGYYGNSEAVFADGIESACDLIAIFATLVALRIGRRPLDGTHPYGHGRAESIAAVFVSVVIIGTGGVIVARSLHTLLAGEYPAPDLFAVLAAATTIAVKEWLYRFSNGIGLSLESPAVLAIARDHRKDALTSIATLIGVTGAYFGLRLLDPLAAILTSVFIFHIGFQTLRSAAHDLMDGRPSEESIAAITALAETVDGVDRVHEIRARRSGQYLLVDLKLEMDPLMTVKVSHDIAIEVKRKIFRRFPNVGDVMIHINPHDEEHTDLTRL